MTVITIGTKYLNMNSDCDYHIEPKSRTGGLGVGMHLSDFCEWRYPPLSRGLCFAGEHKI